MTLDVRGSLKNTKLSKNRFVIFDELFTNAVDAFLIRKLTDPSVERLFVSFTVQFFETDLLDDKWDIAVSCVDNGFGLDDVQTKAFLTKDTSYKDDLTIPGIGACKGSGRVQFFHHFSEFNLVSIFDADGQLYRRSLSFDEEQKEINNDQFLTTAVPAGEIGTEIRLSCLKPAVREGMFSDIDLSDLFSAKKLKRHLMVSFMHRLVGLKPQLGDFKVNFKTVRNSDEEVEVLGADDLPDMTTAVCIKVCERDPATGDMLTAFHPLTISHYKLSSKDYDLPSNVIALCATSAPVRHIADYYLKTKSIENQPVGGFYHVVLIEGDILDDKVNEQRDDFDIPDTIQGGDLFRSDRISFADIHDAIDEVINSFVVPPDWDREGVVLGMSERFGVSQTMLAETDTRVIYGDTPRTVVERVLAKYQKRALEETSDIFDLKEEIAKTEPDTETFRQKVNELAWKYTSSIRNIDMANLSQLVVRRAAIVEILALACKRELSIQNDPSGSLRKDERLIHSIFFPMRKDTRDVKDHDIWLLNEEYHYYKYVASDMPLAQIRWQDEEHLFESDIDEELARLLQKNADDNAGKRPDIALFNKEGSAIIIEFKSPGVSMDDHVGDLMEYAQLLAAKSHGRLKRFYGYLIGDTVNPRRLRNYTRFPSDRGYFGTDSIVEHSTGSTLGELYSEILYYEDIVDRASKRLEVYRDRLKVDFS